MYRRINAADYIDPYGTHVKLNFFNRVKGVDTPQSWQAVNENLVQRKRNEL